MNVLMLMKTVTKKISNSIQFLIKFDRATQYYFAWPMHIRFLFRCVMMAI